MVYVLIFREYPLDCGVLVPDGVVGGHDGDGRGDRGGDHGTHDTRGGYLHTRSHHQRHRGQEGVRGYGRVQLCGKQYI